MQIDFAERTKLPPRSERMVIRMDNGKEASFEQSMKRLEEIVKRLEGGNLPLEDSLVLFEEGTAIVRKSASYLDCAEQKITQLMSKKEADE